MKSSACKSVLDKVSKFEKKYAKPLPKTKCKEDPQFKHDENGVFSESLENEIKVFKPELSINDDELRGFPKHTSPNVSDMSDISNSTPPVRSFQRSSKTKGIGKVTLVSKNGVKINSIENRNKIISFSRQSDTDSTSSNIDNLLSAKEKRHGIVDKGKNKSNIKEFNRDMLTFNDANLKNFVLKESERIASDDSRTSLEVEDVNEKEVATNRLRMSLNLKLYEDPEEVTDISCKDITSASLEHSNVSEYASPHILTEEESITTGESKGKELNEKKSSDDYSEKVQLRIFTFEDLIELEESMPIDEEIMNNLQDKRTSDVLKTGSHLQINTSLQSRDENAEGNSQNKSDGVCSEEILTNKGSIDETSITEDIEELENLVNENTSQFSEQILSSFKDIRHYDEIEAVQKMLKIKNNIKFDKNVSDSIEEKEENSISPQENEKNEILQTVKPTDKNLIKYKEHNRKEKFVNIEHSNKNLKLFGNQNCNVTQNDTKQIKHIEKKHCKGERKSKFKIIDGSKFVSQTDHLRQASTQTDNLFLSETYEYEKRMDSIIKSSFNSMTDIANFEFKMNNIFKDHIYHADISAAPSWGPLERGFHCALRQQVELTKNFVRAEYNMYDLCMTAIKEMSVMYKPATIPYFKKTKKETYE